MVKAAGVLEHSTFNAERSTLNADGLGILKTDNREIRNREISGAGSPQAGSISRFSIPGFQFSRFPALRA
jgi:hypothetical protein